MSKTDTQAGEPTVNDQRELLSWVFHLTNINKINYKQMKILVLAECLRINTTSAAICSSNVIASLLKAGHSIECIYDYHTSDTFPWLSGDIRFYPIKEISSEPSALKKRFPFVFQKFDLFHFLTTGYSYNNSQKILAWKKEIGKQLIENNFDFILVLGAGTSFLPHFAMSQLKTNIKWIANYHDPYPVHLYPDPYRSRSNKIVEKIQYRNSNRVMKKAFKVSFPSLRLMEWMIQFHPVLKGKSFVLPHPNGELKNLPVLQEDNNINLPKDKFNILHAGTLLEPRNPKVLLNAYLKFIESDSERKEKSTLHIVGYMSKHKYITQLKEFGNNLNVINTRISYFCSKKILSQADVLIILEADAKDSPFMPGKIVDYIVADKLIMALTPSMSETTRLLKSNYPYITENKDEENVLDILNQLWDKWKNGEALHLNRPDLLEYISAENCNKILLKEFEK